MGAPSYFANVVSGLVQGPNLSLDGTVPSGGIAVTEGEFASVGPWSSVTSGVVTAGTAPGKSTAEMAAAALLAAGLTITSTGTPSINGTYAADDATLQLMRRSIDAAGNAPVGSVWPAKLATGAWVGVGSAAHMSAIYGVLCMFNYCCNATINGVTGAPTPSATATIA